ncbi:MAG: hypothetical protein CVV42_12935 [Candidatus Riflebacteria bacterium HGW-Riflebacteria-2]|nr:MAG: hypothetical protein CVV42_12935 [Candidatus Riflebacteria bacterium HGW-Riflebacteria-2]
MLNPKVHLKSLVTVLCLIFTVFFTNSAGAIDNAQLGEEPEIELVASMPTELQPGQIFNLSFLITNKSSKDEEFVEKIDLPEGFNTLLSPETISLRPLQSQISIVSLRVSRAAPAGKHAILFSVSGKSGQKASLTSTVTVSSVARLTMHTEEKPDNIIAGESFLVKVRILNEGNATVNAALMADKGKNFRARVEPEEISLPPGSATLVIVNVSTEISEKRITTLFLNLKAQDLKPGERRTLESIAIGVEKIPRAYGTVDLNHRVPTRMTLINLGDGTSQWNQIEIAGGGSLDDSGTRQIDFLLRTPDQNRKSLFGMRDEFYFNYFTDEFSARAGDQSYSLSYLTNFYSYGRGFELNLNESKPTRFGFFNLTSRWDEPRIKQIGLYAGHDLNDKLKFKINHFRQEQQGLFSNASFNKQITSLEVELAPDERSNLKFEHGQSTTTWGNLPNDTAYRLQYRAELPKRIRLTLDKIHAGPDYAGPIRDIDHAFATFEAPLLNRVQGRVRYSCSEQNIGFDPNRGASAQETLWQYGLNFQLKYGLNFSIDLDRLRRYDRFEPASFDLKEKAYRGMLAKSWKRFDLRWEVRHWQRTESVGIQTTWNDSHSYFAVFRPSQKFFFSVYGGFSKNQGKSGSFILRNYENLGFSSRWQPSNRLSLNFWYLKYDYSGISNETSQGNFGLEYKLPHDAVILLKARNNVSWLAEKGPVFYELSYSVPIDIPVRRNTKIGSLSGRVIDAELPGKPAIPNVILIMAGTAAVTNSSGQFVFPAMTCGTHTLTIEAKSIGFNRISSIKMPAEVLIVGGKTNKIAIEMVKGSQLIGKFARPANAQGVFEAAGEMHLTGDTEQILKKSPAPGLANILVELSQEGESLRRASDGYGEFHFDSLKPGIWHYKVYEQSLPENHYLKNAEGEIDLGSGETRELTFEVLPRKRRIQIIDEGEIKIE